MIEKITEMLTQGRQAIKRLPSFCTILDPIKKLFAWFGVFDYTPEKIFYCRNEMKNDVQQTKRVKCSYFFGINLCKIIVIFLSCFLLS